MKSNPFALMIWGPTFKADIRSQMKYYLIKCLRLTSVFWPNSKHFTTVWFRFFSSWQEYTFPNPPNDINLLKCLGLYFFSFKTVYPLANGPNWQRISTTFKYFELVIVLIWIWLGVNEEKSLRLFMKRKFSSLRSFWRVCFVDKNSVSWVSILFEWTDEI